MVETQLRARGIRDERLLSGMAEVPRHEFVEPQYRSQAYEDHPLPIGAGQTVSQPYIVGLMLELLRLEPSSKVLEIGTGSGYQPMGSGGAEEPLAFGDRVRPGLAERVHEHRTFCRGGDATRDHVVEECLA